jgi:hypothetical protein
MELSLATSTQRPVVFVSYSWSSPAHEDFVQSLAAKLSANGVYVRLDKWDLKEGQDKFAFMESMVTDPTVSKVLVICDAQYKAKADGRKGGVGTETEIISSEIYGKVTQEKFIPIVVEYDEARQPTLPTFMKSRIYIDLSDDDVFGDSFMQLLHVIYDRPRYKRPELGAPPDFLDLDVDHATTIPVREFQSLRAAIEEGRTTVDGLEAIYVKAFVGELSKLLVTKETADFDDEIVASIDRAKPLRDQFDHYVSMRAAFSSDSPKAFRRVLALLEQVLCLRVPPEGMSSYRDEWFDVYRFLAWEFMLLTVAALLREHAWQSLDQICSETFIFQRNGADRDRNFLEFEPYLRSLDDRRNRRLGLNRVSLQTDLIHDRVTASGMTFIEIMQADVFLSLRSLVHQPPNQMRAFWFPRTLLYLDGQRLPLFAKTSRVDIKQGLLTALAVSNSNEFSERFERAAAGLKNFSEWRMDSEYIDIRIAANVAQLSA